jgi:hypothetical protein
MQTEAFLHTAPYVWAEQYQTAVFELDSEKLFAEISKAEALIQRRKAELLQESPASSAELAAIARALQVLIQLREIEQKRVAGQYLISENRPERRPDINSLLGC